MQAIPADDVRIVHAPMISDERGETAKQNAGHELEAQNEDLLRDVGGFRYKPKRDFPFARLANLRGARDLRPPSSAGTACTYDSQRK